ncbi:porin [Pseudorhodoferax sp.]|uniref:porin n=1 Tax=Pseudorhodoferax sp. TaxID=1993553 RepID=UPI002DD61D46|nr:porin [Pseudorhodoferax sp.]
MKKFATLAVLAAASAASFAQSSVTLFGVADGNIQVGRGSANNKTGVGSGGNASSRIGFRGIEDLGGGLKAGFWLEAGYNQDDGTGNSNLASGTTSNNQFGADASGAGLRFARRATVSLIGDSWGEIRLGRDFSLQYLTGSAADVFGDNGVGASLATTYAVNVSGPVATRLSNSVTYFTPNFGGVYGALQAYRGEQNAGATKDNGNGYSGRLGYKNGPIDVSVAYGKTDYASDPANFRIGDIKEWGAAAAYDFGVATATLGYRKAEVKNAVFGDPESTAYIVGAKVPVGAGEIRASYSRGELEYTGVDAKADKYAIGYVHNLSKRTALYSTFAYVKNKGGSGIALNGSSLTSANDSSKGLDIGLRHAF